MNYFSGLYDGYDYSQTAHDENRHRVVKVIVDEPKNAGTNLKDVEGVKNFEPQKNDYSLDRDDDFVFSVHNPPGRITDQFYLIRPE